ncbi:acyl-CoA dehydrogenase family protein [Pseudoalteromonas xiamenensis]|uniref:Acyl-CoA dehydrogenase family protein n=1 Tax=Pseudoalteromonas xiamenensis TaxID=882626 RepID=A0A975DKI5_9GAMM|nr:acyl-CoA dehydrogenase family protein [Pseudoalteromonas xiamenensis]QTH73219.1 acyl-CoA dehydrogenase family protein [Pseudoalteromonas xiamenensis]
MDFAITSYQQSLYDSALRFSQEVLDKGAATRLSKHAFDKQLWQKAAEFGFAGLPIDEMYCGSGLNVQNTMLMVEALGKGSRDLGLAFSMCAHLFACVMPLARFGSTYLKQTYLEALSTGGMIAANAATEPTAGSDIYAMAATAKKVDGGYLLNGQKTFITNAPVADVFIVYAKTAPEFGFMGVSCFLVEKSAAGLSVGANHPKDCLSTCPWSDVFFDDVFVPETHLIGSEGAGGAIFHDSMIWEKGCLFALFAGALERIVESTIEYAKERKQFKKRIGHFQSVSNRIIDMKLRLEQCKLMLYRAGWKYDQGLDAEMDIAMSKMLISDYAVQSALDAIQTFGGSAMDREMGIIRQLLDVLPSRTFSGTNDIQREIIARKLGLRSA